jgi:hypothetical protein
MNTNSKAFFNRIEIIFYSTLISCMSGINHIRARAEQAVNLPPQPTIDEDKDYSPLNSKSPARLLIDSWTYLRQALIPLLVWVIFGFAAGFMLGMIRPW